MKNFLLYFAITLFVSVGANQTSAESLAGDKRKNYSNNKTIKKNSKKRHKAVRVTKLSSGSSQIKKRNYPFS